LSFLFFIFIHPPTSYSSTRIDAGVFEHWRRARTRDLRGDEREHLCVVDDDLCHVAVNLVDSRVADLEEGREM